VSIVDGSPRGTSARSFEEPEERPQVRDSVLEALPADALASPTDEVLDARRAEIMQVPVALVPEEREKSRGGALVLHDRRRREPTHAPEVRAVRRNQPLGRHRGRRLQLPALAQKPGQGANQCGHVDVVGRGARRECEQLGASQLPEVSDPAPPKARVEARRLADAQPDRQWREAP
jgi:hypothetical protein